MHVLNLCKDTQLIISPPTHNQLHLHMQAFTHMCVCVRAYRGVVWHNLYSAASTKTSVYNENITSKRKCNNNKINLNKSIKTNNNSNSAQKKKNTKQNNLQVQILIGQGLWPWITTYEYEHMQLCVNNSSAR